MTKEELDIYFFANVKIPVYDWLVGNYWQMQELIEGADAESHNIMFPRAFADNFLAHGGMEDEQRENLKTMVGDGAMVPGSLDRNNKITMHFNFGEKFSAAAKEWCDG